MSTDIQLLRSSVAFKRPAVAPLLDGQAAININPSEPGLFFKNSTGTDLIKVGPVAVNTSGDAPNSNPAGSTGNSIGETWLDGRAAFANPAMKVWDGLAWKPSSGFEVDDTTGAFTLDRLMTVRTLESDGTGADSYLRLPQDDDTARAAIAANQGMIRFNTTSSLFEGYDGSDWNSFSLSQGDIVIGDLTVTGNTILGDNCAEDTLTINSVTLINCDTTIGVDSTNTLSVESVVSSDLVPDGTGTRTLGATTARWNAFTNDLSATGNTILGDDDTVDTVTVTATLTQNGLTEFLNSTTMWNSQELRFSSAVAPNPTSPYVSFQSPSTLVTPVRLVLPDSLGSPGEVLSTDGSGNLSWATGGSGGGGTVEEAPIDGQQYAREDGGWTVVDTGGAVDSIIAGTGVIVSPVSGTGDVTISADTSSLVSSIIAGDNITISPVSGTGDVTINATGGGNMSLVDLTVTGNTILGDDCSTDTLTINAVTFVNCDMVIGDTTSNTLSVVSGISTDLLPAVDDTINLGSSTQRWANIYTGDLHLANDRGDWTVIEEETYLSLRNNKSGKTFKIVMEEI